jgi:iron complex transport system permease protein
MKVTLDLTKLLEDGKITRAEFDKLSALSAQGTGSAAFNILIGFGVIAVAGGSLALVPTPVAAIAIGALVAAVGLGLMLARSEQWGLLADICILAGALLLAGGIVVLGNGSAAAYALVTVLFAAAGIAIGSGLLMACAVLALASCIGARTGYMHATYFLGVQEPALTVVIFSLLALAAYHVSKTLSADYERLAIVVARTSIFMVNFGFWIGSLWGDRLTWLVAARPPGEGRGAVILDWHFAVLWALALIGAAIWAAKNNRRWVVNIAAVFGAIHFYTQWFEHLGASPVSVVIAGVLALGIALGLWHFNRRWETGAARPSAA